MQIASSSPRACSATAVTVAAIQKPSEGGYVTMYTAAPQATTSTREMLTTIPPEIRNRIYELVMPAPDPETEADLLTAEPPSKALLLTCRQICGEARVMYRRAYRRFWTSTRFRPSVKGIEKDSDLQNSLVSYMRHTRDLDIAHVTHLQVCDGDGGSWHLKDSAWVDGKNSLDAIVVPRAKWEAVWAAGYAPGFVHTRAVTYADVYIARLALAEIDEITELVGKSGLAKGEVLDVIELLTCWLMPGPHTWE